MRNSQQEAARWLSQAENDIAFAEIGLREGFYAQACFLAQQAAEKALKAVHYAEGARFVLGHSVLLLIQELKEQYPDFLQDADIARELDQYYIPTRYPDGLPESAPHEFYSSTQAESAITGAKGIIEKARQIVQPREEGANVETEETDA
ncbi:MAG: HEPN domain-containing protein [Candidatus Poribacteria bacterium]